jgi:hypothetical protein
MRNGVDIRDLNGLEAATSLLPLIGFTVLWRLEGIRVSHPDLEQALQSAGFEKYLPDPPTRRVALRRALAEWIKSVLAVRRRNLRLPFAYPLLGLSSAFAKPKKDFFSFFTTRCRKNTKLLKLKADEVLAKDGPRCRIHLHPSL